MFITSIEVYFLKKVVNSLWGSDVLLVLEFINIVFILND